MAFIDRLGRPKKDSGFRDPDYWVWGASVLRDEAGTYHMFVSRWPRAIPFHPGWITDSEIVRCTAEVPEGPYAFREVVLGKRGAEYWDGRMAHNPRIMKVNGGYVLFYTGSTHPFEEVEPGEAIDNSDRRTIVGRSNKRVGIATAPSLEGPWTRYDQPVLPTRPGTYYSFLTSNVAPIIEPDGTVFCLFKSRRYEGHVHSRMFIGAARALDVGGPYKVVSTEPVFGPGHLGEIEDPSLWRDRAGYVMVAKDMTGELCGECGAGIIARSPDGLHWQLDDPSKAYSMNFTWSDGEAAEVGKLERAFVLTEQGRPTHLFCAVSTGGGTSGRPMDRTWNMVFPIEG
ncbi:MAG: glycoside hydrolase family protein [Planctomycetota bacterium]